MLDEALVTKRLGEDVCRLICGGNAFDGDAPTFDLLFDEEVTNVNVLETLVLLVIVCDGQSSVVVLEYWRW